MNVATRRSVRSKQIRHRVSQRPPAAPRWPEMDRQGRPEPRFSAISMVGREAMKRHISASHCLCGEPLIVRPRHSCPHRSRHLRAPASSGRPLPGRKPRHGEPCGSIVAWPPVQRKPEAREEACYPGDAGCQISGVSRCRGVVTTRRDKDMRANPVLVRRKFTAGRVQPALGCRHYNRKGHGVGRATSTCSQGCHNPARPANPTLPGPIRQSDLNFALRPQQARFLRAPRWRRRRHRVSGRS
jgi:hypothetical protein